MRQGNIIKKSYLILLLFLITGSFSVIAVEQAVFNITSDIEASTLGKKLSILEDPLGELTIADVTSLEMDKKFIRSNKDYLSLGFTTSTYWVKLTVYNSLETTSRWLLESQYPLIDYLTFYKPDREGGWSVLKYGDHFPFNKRKIKYRNFVFGIEQLASTTSTYYLRYQTSSSMKIPLNFWTQRKFMEKVSFEETLHGIFFGTILIMIFYNLYLFYGLREMGYLYYVIAIISMGITAAALNGHSFQYLWPQSTWWANSSIPVLIYVCAISTNIMAMSIMEMSVNAPRWNRLLKYFTGLWVIGIVVSFYTPYIISSKLAVLAALISIIYLVFAGISCMKNGSRPAYYFILEKSVKS